MKLFFTLKAAPAPCWSPRRWSLHCSEAEAERWGCMKPPKVTLITQKNRNVRELTQLAPALVVPSQQKPADDCDAYATLKEPDQVSDVQRNTAIRRFKVVV